MQGATYYDQSHQKLNQVVYQPQAPELNQFDRAKSLLSSVLSSYKQDYAAIKRTENGSNHARNSQNMPRQMDDEFMSPTMENIQNQIRTKLDVKPLEGTVGSSEPPEPQVFENSANFMPLQQPFRPSASSKNGTLTDHEQFFESLGLPGNLNLPKHSQAQQQQQPQEHRPYDNQEVTNILADFKQAQMLSQKIQPSFDKALHATQLQSYPTYEQQANSFGASGRFSAQNRSSEGTGQQFPSKHQETEFFTCVGQQSNTETEDALSRGTGAFSEDQLKKFQRKELLTLTIEVGEGRTDDILVREGDNPFNLAADFAQKYGIGEQLRNLLAEQIAMNMDQVKAQEVPQVEVNGQELAMFTQSGRNQDQMYLSQLNNHQTESTVSQYTQQNQQSYRKPASNHTSTQKPVNSNAEYRDPFSEHYQSWRHQVNQRLHKNAKDQKNTPAISHASRQIVEEKRSLMAGPPKPVHERLHRAAVTKQQRKRNTDSVGSDRRSNGEEPQQRLAFGSAVPQGPRHRSASRNSQEREPRNMSIRQGQLQRPRQSPAHKPPMIPGQKNLNYGERLYYKGVQRNKMRDNEIEQARNDLANLEMDEITFKPETNESGLPRREARATEDLLHQFKQRRDESLEHKRAMQDEEEMKECRFMPDITKKSAQMVHDRSAISQTLHSTSKTRLSSVRSWSASSRQHSKCNELYQDGKRRIERKLNIYGQCIDAECTFAPDMAASKSSAARIKRYGSHKHSNRKSEGASVFEKLSQGLGSSRERSQACLAHSQNLSNDLYDPETGQEFFKPKTGRAPSKQNRPAPKGAAINKMLYKQGQARSTRQHNRNQEAAAQKSEKHNTVFTSNQTKVIMEKLKVSSFKQIFQWLDSDQDGYVSANKIDISCVSPELLEVMSPLFCEMEELQQALDQEEFVDALGRLYDSISLPEKEKLLMKPDSAGKKQMNVQKHAPAYNFQPAINDNSKKMAKNQGQDVSERLYRHSVERQKKLQEKQDEELFQQAEQFVAFSNAAEQEIQMMHAKTRDSQMKHQTINHSSNFNGSFVSVGNNSGPYHLLSQQPSQMINDQIHMFNSNNQPEQQEVLMGGHGEQFVDHNSLKIRSGVNSDPLTIHNRDLTTNSVYSSSQHNPSQLPPSYEHVQQINQLSPSKQLLGGKINASNLTSLDSVDQAMPGHQNVDLDSLAQYIAQEMLQKHLDSQQNLILPQQELHAPQINSNQYQVDTMKEQLAFYQQDDNTHRTTDQTDLSNEDYPDESGVQMSGLMEGQLAGGSDSRTMNNIQKILFENNKYF